MLYRTISNRIKSDLDRKIVLLEGPRQCGKTTLSKSLYKDYTYFNYDDPEQRAQMLKKLWRRDCECIIFDEIHKMPEWKRWLKGLYDTEGCRPRILVTGSAQLETFSNVGDSLAGRYFLHRLDPLDIRESVECWGQSPEQSLLRILSFSGFPEPFLEGHADYHRKWQKTHLDVIVRQDFLDLYAIKNLKNLEILLHLLRPRVGSSISYATLANDIQVDQTSIKSWLLSLEKIYAIFKITPYHHNIARSLLKEPKYYFFDLTRAENPGGRLENCVALCLLKAIHQLEDLSGWTAQLHYLRTKDGKELDFLVTINNQPYLAIEVKTTDTSPSNSFQHFSKFLPEYTEKIQLVQHIDREYDTSDGIKIRNLANYLAKLDLHKYVATT
ncbi:MAG: ATP-binding protein [Gammaproteobacteria bacterium]|nr:ATP-binding protein [Gammaproteobacteria bacterium]